MFNYKLIIEYYQKGNNHSEIPWRAIKGMRNRIVHEYGDVEISIVYETVVSDLPVLLKQLQDIVL